MASMVGLSKEQIRRITLNKLRVVYREWGIGGTPFARTGTSTRPGGRRDDPRAFVVALVAALLGGLSEAIERNNRGLAAALTRRPRGRASGKTPHRRTLPRGRPLNGSEIRGAGRARRRQRLQPPGGDGHAH